MFPIRIKNYSPIETVTSPIIFLDFALEGNLPVNNKYSSILFPTVIVIVIFIFNTYVYVLILNFIYFI